MREFELIQRLLERRGTSDPPWLPVGPGDDAAVLEVGGARLAWSVDATFEEVHFRRGWAPPETLGRRAMAAALSDLAAMAARPLAALLDLAVPRGDAAWAEGFFAGASRLVEEAGGTVAGGNITAAPAGGAFGASITVLGEQDLEPPLRSGARPGDTIWVTGAPGAARVGLQHLQAGGAPESPITAAFLRPTPRLEEARALVRQGRVTALIDLSDGLAGDLGHVLAASRVGAELEVARLDALLPAEYRAAAQEQGARPHEMVLGGGGDYELLVVVRGQDPPEWPEGELPLRRIGVITAGGGLLLRDGAGGRTPWTSQSFEHEA